MERQKSKWRDSLDYKVEATGDLDYKVEATGD